MSRNSEANRKAYYEASKVERVCPCGRTFMVSRFNKSQHCSLECGNQFRKGLCTLPVGHEVRRRMAAAVVTMDQRSPLRIALEDGNIDDVIHALADKVVIEGECWMWQGQSVKSHKSSGRYPVLRIGRNSKGLLHRLVAAAKYGPLGKQPVHHKCANTLCLNPEHLQPVSHRENVAEMLARNYMLTRIAQLEEALATHDPAHALLLEVGTPSPIAC